jgi:DNA-binding transcriptional LysR family regulator
MNSLATLTAHAPARMCDLAAFTVLVSDADGDFHKLVERFFESDGVPGPRLHVIGSVEGVKRGVLADTRALGILPSYAIAEELRTGRVVRLSFRPPPPELRLEALLSRSRSRHPSTDDLLAGIQRIFAADTGLRGVETRPRLVR